MGGEWWVELTKQGGGDKEAEDVVTGRGSARTADWRSGLEYDKDREGGRDKAKHGAIKGGKLASMG